MKRIRKFVNKIRKAGLEDLPEDFGQRAVQSAVRLADSIHEYAIKEQVADLLSRIERLEAELHPLRNGQPLRRPTYRD